MAVLNLNLEAQQDIQNLKLKFCAFYIAEIYQNLTSKGSNIYYKNKAIPKQEQP